MEGRLSTHSARIDMIQCMYVKKIEGNSHIFGSFLDNIKNAVECLLNSKTLTLMGNCSIILEEDNEPNAYYNLSDCNIHISTGLLEHLWCLAYFHYDVYARTPWGNPEIDFDVTKYPYEIQYTEESRVVIISIYFKFNSCKQHMRGLVSSLRGISCSIIVFNMCWLITCYRPPN